MKTTTINIDEIDNGYIVSVFDHTTGTYPLNLRVKSRLAALAMARSFVNEQIEIEVDDITGKLERGYL